MLMLGGALSLIATMFLFDFIPGSGVGAIVPALLTGVIEETGKALALLIVAFSPRYRYQLNGLLFGAAVGAGFAGFESAGYALNAAFDGGMGAAIDSITLRALLSPGGHVIWTAMVGSAIWRVKKDSPFRIEMLVHRDVIRRWAIAVILHGIWDADVWVHPYLKLAVLVIVGWYVVLAILKQGLEEVAAVKGAAA
jgi:RsiW-degrading membrane proteinase PrsW (M82 family)